jgi:hypothetical protein
VSPSPMVVAWPIHGLCLSLKPSPHGIAHVACHLPTLLSLSNKIKICPALRLAWDMLLMMVAEIYIRFGSPLYRSLHPQTLSPEAGEESTTAMSPLHLRVLGTQSQSSTSAGESPLPCLLFPPEDVPNQRTVQHLVLCTVHT